MKDVTGGPRAKFLLRSFCFSLFFILLLPVSSWAHGFAGQRFFPTTFQVDDPFISDEFSILINRVKGPDAMGSPIQQDYRTALSAYHIVQSNPVDLNKAIGESGRELARCCRESR